MGTLHRLIPRQRACDRLRCFVQIKYLLPGGLKGLQTISSSFKLFWKWVMNLSVTLQVMVLWRILTRIPSNTFSCGRSICSFGAGYCFHSRTMVV
jgi:hypothetical protein